MFVKEPTPLEDIYLVSDTVHYDKRGSFQEAYNVLSFAGRDFHFHVSQVNLAKSTEKGTVRGMHWQDPHPQTKLVYCIRGSIYDVVVDLRAGSPGPESVYGVVLSAPNSMGILIPPGFAHGWQALKENSEILYIVENLWNPKHERGIRPDDPALKIPWPLPLVNVSQRDLSWPLLGSSK